MGTAFTRTINFYKWALLLVVVISSSLFEAYAQTPGLIVRRGNVLGAPPPTIATALDPNNDGWTSTTNAGFLGNDITNSELVYQIVPIRSSEIIGDAKGPTAGMTDIIQGPNDDGFFFYSDGVNLLFRMRVGSIIPGLKGYSALIDSDGKFGNSGPNSDPTWTSTNPGFEYEIQYTSGNAVTIWNINGPTPTVVATYPLSSFPQYAQVSVAEKYTNPIATAYFYDWYVPIAAFSSEPGDIAITPSSPLRMTAGTTQGNTRLIQGRSASDYQGDDTQFANPIDQLLDAINNQSGTAPDGSSGPNLLCTAPTRLNAPIAPGATSISGLWTTNTSVTSATIEVFRIRGITTTSLGTVTATSATTWTLGGLVAGDVIDGDIIYATAQGTGQAICGESNSVAVQDCTPSNRPAQVVMTGSGPGGETLCFSNRGAVGTSAPNATITLFNTSTGISYTVTANASGLWFWLGTGTTGNANNACSTGTTDVPDGVYAISQSNGSCSSAAIFQSSGCTTTTATPTINQSTINEVSTVLSGTATAGSTVRLYLDGIELTNTTATGGIFSFDLSTIFPIAGQVFSVRARATGECLSAPVSRTVVLAPIFCNLTSPFITNNGSNQIQAGSAISGVSSEPVGTQVTVYNASSDAVIGTTTVAAGGVWTLATPVAVSGTSYYARHTGTSCGTSNSSNTVTALAASTATCGTITGPILENATAVSGTGYSSGSLVRLFIDGGEIGDAIVDGSGNWSINVNVPGDPPSTIYAGGVLTTTVENAGQIPSTCVSSVTVDCVAPAAPLISTTTPISVTTASFSVSISNSIAGVLYYIEDAIDDATLGQTIGTQRGISVFGNGGSLTLTSSALMIVDGTYEFVVRANPLTTSSCIASSTSFEVIKTTASTVEAILPDFAVTHINSQVSGNVSTNDVLLGTIAYSNATGQLAGATLTLNADGTYDFVATATGVFVYEINVCTDPATPPACPTSFLTITVTDPTLTTNPPIANPDVYPVLQGQTLSGNVLGNDLDLSGTGLIVTELNGTTFTTSTTITNYGGSGGNLVLNYDGTFTLTNPTVPGTYTFTYTVCDQATPQTCALPVTVTIEVYPTGTPNLVYANDDYANISQGGVASGNLLTNDTQLSGAAITAATAKTEVVLGVGTFEVDANGDYTFTTVASFSGAYQFTYEALGASGASAIGTFHVTVEPFRINPDIAVAFKDETINGSVATNDVVPAGSTYTTATVLANATLTLNPNGTYTFVATAAGVYTYNIQVCAPTTPPGCETKTLTITVTDPAVLTNLPVANNDLAVTYLAADPSTTAGVPVTINVIANDQAGNNGGSLVVGSVTLVGGPITGLVNNGDGTFTYTPPIGQGPGVVTFQYTVSDGTLTSPPATVFITLYPASTPNVVTATDDYVVTTSTASTIINILANDTQLDGTTPLFIPATGVGTFAITGGNVTVAADGTVTFTPDPTFNGTTSYTYTAEGTDGATGSGTVYFTVYGDLIVNPDIAVAFKDETINGSVATNDVVPAGSTYTTATVLANATLTLNPNGTYTFVATAAGVYTYDIQVCAPTTPPGCETKTLTITVTDPALINNPPVANNDIAVTYADADPANPGVPVAIDVAANDQAGNNGGTIDPTTVAISAGPSDGITSIDPITGVITYTPNAGFTGLDSFTYTIDDTDGNGPSTGTVFITVYPASTPNVVTATDDYVSTSGITPVSGSVIANDTQLSGTTLTVSNPGTYTVAGVGSLLLNANGTFTFTPVAGFEGTASFTYNVTGTSGATASATLHVSVFPPLTYTWTGGTDTNWCDPLNWDRGAVPVAGANVVIPDTTNDPAFDVSGCPVCINNLTIASGVSLGLTGKLCVTGTLDSRGSVVGAGSIALEGTTLQTIIGEFNINNLELNNTAGATITSGAGNIVQITESLRLIRGNLTTNSNLRLMSDASGDAYIAPIADADCGLTGIVGNVRIQKFVAGGNRAFRFIAHPFNGTISLQQIRDYVHITGEGLDFNDTGNPSAFWYVTTNGNQAEDDEDTGWVPVTSTSLGDWFKGRAVRMLFRGPRTQGGVVGDDDYVPQLVTYELIGEVNLCNQTLTNLRRVGTPGDPAGLPGNSAYNFIGNPFPAGINLKTIPAGSRANLGPNYYLWQPRTGLTGTETVFGPGGGRGGSYVSEPFELGTPALGELAMGTGFFVVANVDNASITFTEANKIARKTLTPGAAVTFREESQSSRYGANTVQISLENGEAVADRVLLYFGDEYAAKTDQWDAFKFQNPGLNFFTVSEDDYALAIDRRPWVENKEHIVPLYIQSPAVEYTLKVPDFDLQSGRKLYLLDRFTSTKVEIKAGMEYKFNVTADPKSKDHRFDIIMGADVVTSLDKSVNGFMVFLLPNPAQQQVAISIARGEQPLDLNVRVYDSRGIKLFETQIAPDSEARVDYQVDRLSKGMYLVEVQQGKQRVVKKLVVN